MRVYVNKNRDLHRSDAPSVMTPNGLEQWFQDNKLHRAEEPAVKTKSGTVMHYWRGIFISPLTWARRHTMPIQEVLDEENVEIRRCLLEMRGWERFIKEAKAEVLDRDKKREAVLYRIKIDDPADEYIVVVQVTNGTPEPDGTFKKYFLRVPPNMTNVLEAIAWTFDVTVPQYKELEVET